MGCAPLRGPGAGKNASARGPREVRAQEIWGPEEVRARSARNSEFPRDLEIGTILQPQACFFRAVFLVLL